jgi:hypothetical protein
MLQRFLQIAFLLAGMSLVVDFAMPSRRQASEVTGHAISSDTEGESIYEVMVSGGDIESCSVSPIAHEELKVGDRIEIKANHLFDTCTRIARGDEVIYSTWAQPFVSFIAGVILFGFGLMLSRASTGPGQSD